MKPFLALRSYLPADHPDKHKEIGSEPTPEQFIDTLLDVVEALTPKLAPHGSICFELGDTYSGSGGAGGDYNAGGLRDGQNAFDGSSRRSRSGWDRLGARAEQPDQPPNYRKSGTISESFTPNGGPGWPLPKSLCMIPESFRWALVYGRNPFNGRTTPRWRARNVIRVCKPNPPVGALGDKFRPGTSEMVVACKSSKRYFDLDAVRTQLAEHTLKYPNDRYADSPNRKRIEGVKLDGEPERWDDGIIHGNSNPAGAPPLDWWEIPTEPLPGFDPAPQREPKPRHNDPYSKIDPETGRPKYARRAGGAQPAGMGSDAKGEPSYGANNPAGAPPLDYWVIPTEPYSGSHYATFPRKLLDIPILAMSPQRVCRVCGEPSRRIVETGEVLGRGRSNGGVARGEAVGDPNNTGGRIPNNATSITLGWSDCGCPGDHWRRGLILDPFAGSGTTLEVANAHGRDAVGIDIDARNAELAVERCGLFLEVESSGTVVVALPEQSEML